MSKELKVFLLTEAMLIPFIITLSACGAKLGTGLGIILAILFTGFANLLLPQEK